MKERVVLTVLMIIASLSHNIHCYFTDKLRWIERNGIHNEYDIT